MTYLGSKRNLAQSKGRSADSTPRGRHVEVVITKPKEKGKKTQRMIAQEALEWVIEQCSTLALASSPHSKKGQPSRNDGGIYGLNAKWYVGSRRLPEDYWKHPVHFHADLGAIQIMVCRYCFAMTPRC